MRARVIAVSPDLGVGETLARALAPMGAEVQVHRTLLALSDDDLDAPLYVIHFTEQLASSGVAAHLGRLAGDARVIALMPSSDLANLVEIMRGFDRVIGVVVLESLEQGDLASLATRVLTGEIFGLQRVMPKAEIHTLTCEYAERKRCSARIASYLVKSGVPRKRHAAIEQCVDEMLMNALYDAPVDADGNPVFGGVTARDRVALGLGTSVVVQFAYDGRTFGVSVRDVFGSLARQTVLRVLYKCLHAENKIDRKAGGAGVGLYLMVSSATCVYFNVIPGVATEAVCTFAIDRESNDLEQFAFTERAHDVTGTLATHQLSPSDLRPTPIKRTPLVLLAVAAALLVIGLAATAYVVLRPEPAPTKPAILEIDTLPTGAEATIGGKSLGHTPLTVAQLEPGSEVAATFRLRGYRDRTTRLRIPAAGERSRHVEQLELSERFATVRLTSNPPGARVIRAGEQSAARTYTPVEMLVEVGTPHELMLVMPGHVPLVLDPIVAQQPGEVIERGGTLVPGTTVHLEAPEGTVLSVKDVPHCQRLPAPAECTLAPGRYTIEAVGSGASTTSDVTIAGDEQTIDLGGSSVR